MSLGIAVKCPEGIVLTAESRLVRIVRDVPFEHSILSGVADVHVTFDNVTKLVTLRPPNDSVGAVFFSATTPNDWSLPVVLGDFQAGLPAERLVVHDLASRLSAFLVAQVERVKPRERALTIVGGFGPDERYGRLYYFRLPDDSEPVEQYADDFGLLAGGRQKSPTDW